MRNIRNILSLLILSIVFPAFSYNMTGTWKRHPSFYQQTQQIIDTEKSTWFLLHQNYYDTGYTDHTFNTASLFRQRKTGSDNAIKSLASEYDAVTVSFSLIGLSPSSKILTACGDDGSLWFFPDAGEPYAMSGNLNVNKPGKQRYYSLTPDLSDDSQWLGASWGFAKIDPISASVSNIALTDFPVEWIAKIGESLLLVSSGKVYTVSTNVTPKSLSDLTPLSIDTSGLPSYIMENGALTNVSNLMPLTDNTFAFLSSGSDSGTKTLATATRQGSKWKILTFGEDNMRTMTANTSPTSPSINTTSPNKEGYYLQARNASYQILRNFDPDLSASDPASTYKSKILKRINLSDDANQESSSWDFADFRFFTPKKGFYNRNFNGSEWGSPSAKLMPEAPQPFISNYLVMHPTLGLIASTYGVNYNFSQNFPGIPWLVSAFKEGKWNIITPAFYMPDEFNNDENRSKFNSSIEYYPLTHPDGLAIDPNDSKYAYAGSFTFGWARINLADPSKLPLHIGNSMNRWNNTPGFIAGAPVFSSWQYVSDFSEPSFDSKGRLWFLFWDYEKNASDAIYSLQYYESSELKAMENANTNPSLYKAPHIIEMPAEKGEQLSGKLLALNGKGNENKLVMHNGGFGSHFYIYDHNGVPSNPSLAKIARLSNMHDSKTGALIETGNLIGINEDPATGYVWASTINGTFLIDPQLAFTDPDKCVTYQRVKSQDGNGETTLFEAIPVMALTTDAAGNLWVATQTAGIFCLNPSRTELLAEFNTSNSPLPSNAIMGIAFNPERLSVMASTDQGFIEFFPDSLNGDATDSNIMISPANILPDFKGWVTFSGLPAGSSYRIVDNNGNGIASLGAPDNGILQWNVEDAAGMRPAPGRYYLQNSAKKECISFYIVE